MTFLLAIRELIVTTELLLVNKDMPQYKVQEMMDKIDNLDGVSWTISYSTLAGTDIPVDALPKDIKDIFITDKYQMIIINCFW